MDDPAKEPEPKTRCLDGGIESLAIDERAALKILWWLGFTTPQALAPAHAARSSKIEGFGELRIQWRLPKDETC